MTLDTNPTILMVPGLRDHVAQHWQTLLQDKLPKAASVPPLENDKLSCAARVAALDAALATIDGPVILVAHSAGVMITVHWARRHKRKIHGALLVTPADLDTPLPAGYPSIDLLARNGWLPAPRDPLPFRSIVGASRNDPLARFHRVSAMAQDWRSRLVDLGEVGHLNPTSGFGEWPMAERLIRELF
ncbi:RBBP9/YdeN family alpha/beta hydrolase [Paraburkholderia kirstenboschensis]|uniref:Alpha/beta hydrolase n=1 Tax=Paraburkholderia kirstenboschensis TaxID=1245436 RepID=A0ABZ0EUH9_9BURK|nr:alpha/beta hydrolase [Paraburkholderia kirstenboschensis]WOD20550.1 alpha/beta hydrolase [Paraburkholderia kirstenboschensis]